MTSLLTETTEENEAGPPAAGWILFDRDCRSCTDLALRLRSVFARRGFAFVPLQESWVLQALGVSAAEAREEMRVLTRDGTTWAGADAIVFLAGRVWWMSPLSAFAKLPGARHLLRSGYQWIATHRTCESGQAKSSSSVARTRWLPLIVLPLLSFAAKPMLPAWAFMWAMAASLFLGCKWLTLGLAKMPSPAGGPFRAVAYLVAWPGMDAARFLSSTPSAAVSTRAVAGELLFTLGRISVGAFLLFVGARHLPGPLLAGWIGMIGMVLLLHFGFLNLASISWRARRVDAPPIMDAPLRSTSLSEFWGRRWNGAFNQLALRLVFRPIARHTGAAVATLCSFGASGLVHELVISLPANGGYGLPTAYFILQGVAVLAERTKTARRFGLGRGVPGWLFTLIVVAAPAFWLFHPPFIRRVILPFMEAIGAL